MENWLTKRAHLTPNRVAVVAGQTSYTFSKLAQVVAQEAAGLQTNWPSQPKRVAVLTTNSLAGYVTILALQQLGIEMVLLNRRLSAAELRYQIQDAHVAHLLVDDDFPEATLQTLAVAYWRFTTITSEDALADACEVDLDAVTSIMYTSGTTGAPKGVLQTYGNHWYSATGSALNLGLQAADRWLAVVPIFHISGLSILMRGLIYGMTVELVDKFDAQLVNERLLSGEVTTISVVPTMLQQLLANLSERVYPAALRTILLGGGPTDLTTLQRAQTAHANVIQSYGMTETASQIIALDMADAPRKIGSAGKPLFPVQLKIGSSETPFDQREAGESGTIWVQTPTLTPGYLNLPDKLAADMHEGWFKTGDFGYVDAEGFLFIQGREGDMISSGGENIFPDEIEKTYAALPNLTQIGVVGVPDARWGAVPVAFVQGENLTRAELVAFGRENLAHYKVPQKFYVAQSWPMTASGKLQRTKLREQLATAVEIKD